MTAVSAMLRESMARIHDTPWMTQCIPAQAQGSLPLPSRERVKKKMADMISEKAMIKDR